MCGNLSGCQNGFIESINGCFRDECLNERKRTARAVWS
ncbi:integrase core domain-containing protein [Enterobacter ludwigii]